MLIHVLQDKNKTIKTLNINKLHKLFRERLQERSQNLQTFAKTALLKIICIFPLYFSNLSVCV